MLNAHIYRMHSLCMLNPFMINEVYCFPAQRPGLYEYLYLPCHRRLMNRILL